VEGELALAIAGGIPTRGANRGRPAPLAPMNDERSTILVVEDDAATRTFLADNLAADGFEVLVAETARDALRMLERKYPDAVVVDLGLPDADGLALIARVRAADGVATRLNPEVPLLVLTGRGGELERLRGFQRGADDYVVKPFSYQELVLRLRALLRRTARRPRGGRLRVGDLEVDPLSREVLLRGRRIELSQKEFSLLRTLASDPTRVFTKEELLRTVWSFKSMGNTRRKGIHAPADSRMLDARLPAAQEAALAGGQY
jgi:DNA-binding response OmpR family regulator